MRAGGDAVIVFVVAISLAGIVAAIAVDLEMDTWSAVGIGVAVAACIILLDWLWPR